MTAVTTITTKGETSALCASVGVSRASFYRRQRPAAPPRPRAARAPSPRALRPDERQAVLDVLHSERFVDQSPAEVHATLLEEQTYLCSTRTMYRLLADAGEVRERRDQARHPAYTKPALVATRPNQIWSWDITKLKGPVAYLYFSLYVILDLFSRYVVGWMVAAAERARLAERLITATTQKQGIAPHQLTMVMEPLSDTPELFLRTSAQAYEIARAVDSPACKILYDIYHMQRNEGNLIHHIDLTWGEIAYFQIGDVPGRKEPGTGEINYRNVLKYIHERARKEGRDFVFGMEHGNAHAGAEGERRLIQAYREVDVAPAG